MPEGTTLERTRLVIEGVRSELVLEGGRITITKEAPTQAAPSTVDVGVERVRGTTLNAPSRGERGWLHVAVAGGSPAPPGELAAAGDPYTLPITSRSSSAARRFARLVDRHVAERGMPPDPRVGGRRYSSGVSLVDPPDEVAGATAQADPDWEDIPPAADVAAADPGPADAADAADATGFVTQLRQLADLHASGVLTDEEFERAKARLLR